MKKIVQLDKFKKEIMKFPSETRESIFSLIVRFLDGEQLNKSNFKTFKLDKNTKIQEFKVKDDKGNWRAISCFYEKEFLVFIYAFHKKSQKLLEKDKEVIIKRIKDIEL